MNAELIKALRNCSDGFCSLCPYDDYELSTKECEAKLMRDAADALEAAEKKMPKEGEWRGLIIDGQYWAITCSNCHQVGFNARTPYCPNCGARMRGEHDEQ